MGKTDEQIRKDTSHCYVGFAQNHEGTVMLLGPVPEAMPKGGTASIILTKKAQRRLLRELTAALSI